MGFLDRIRNRNAPEEPQSSNEFVGTDLTATGESNDTCFS